MMALSTPAPAMLPQPCTGGEACTRQGFLWSEGRLSELVEREGQREEARDLRSSWEPGSNMNTQDGK